MDIDDFLQKNNYSSIEKDLSKVTEEESFPDSDKSLSPNQIFFSEKVKSSPLMSENIFLPSPDKGKISEFSNNVESFQSQMLMNTSEQGTKISKPILRKKICSKLAKTFQGNFGIEKLKSQQLTLQLEAKIRLKHPDMDAAYKSTLRNFIRFLRVTSLFTKFVYFIDF